MKKQSEKLYTGGRIMIRFSFPCNSCRHKYVCYDKISIVNSVNEIMSDNLSSGRCNLQALFTCNNYDSEHTKGVVYADTDSVKEAEE